MLALSDLTEALRTLRVPISVVLPDASPFVPVAHGTELTAIAPDVRLRVVAGVRHGLPFSHAAAESRALLDVLRQVEARAQAFPPMLPSHPARSRR